MSLRETLSNYWYAFQQELFPRLEADLGCLSERYEFFVTVVEFVRLEVLLPSISGLPGRPPEDRAALARAFIAKAVFDIPTTRALIERLQVDRTLYRLCGWSGVCRLPSEATFSRGFAEFADSALASRLHEALIARTLKDHLVGHISRDATAITGREKPLPKAHRAARPKRQQGRPRKGEERPREPTRLERQLTMTLPEMLGELPKACDVGVKKNAKGALEKWVGYKLHIDAADGGIPVSCILTSASMHDSQAAIALACLTAGRVDNLYDPGSGPGQALMDAAYDARGDTSPQPGPGPHGDHRHQPPPLGRTQRGDEARSEGAACDWLCVSRSAALQRALDCRAGQCAPQGRVRRPSCSGPGACEGALPPHVRNPRADGQPVDTSAIAAAPTLSRPAHPDITGTTRLIRGQGINTPAGPGKCRIGRGCTAYATRTQPLMAFPASHDALGSSYSYSRTPKSLIVLQVAHIVRNYISITHISVRQITVH